MLYRARFIIGVLVTFLLLWLISSSCHIDVKNGKYQLRSNESDRHNVLTFFLDGVPPPGGTEVDEVPTDVNTPQVLKRPEVIWYVHEPTRSKENCGKCHGSLQQRSFSSEVQMTSRVPDMCYQCHEELMPAALEGWVHGPVSVGVCLFCHEPHKSQNQYLLKKAIPELCFGCHEADGIKLIPNHSKEIYSKCHNCHESHSTSERYLLKPDWQEKAVEEPEPEAEIEEPKPDAETEEQQHEAKVKEPEIEEANSEDASKDEIEEPKSEIGP